MPLRKANLHEAENILKFYKNVIDSIKDSEFKPRWSDSYPNLEFLKEHIKKEELYIYLNDNDIVSAFILNNQFDNDYSDVKWLTDARLSENISHTHLCCKFQLCRRRLQQKNTK